LTNEFISKYQSSNGAPSRVGKEPNSDEAETEPLHALARNRTVIKLSLWVRNSSQRDQINLIVTGKHQLGDDQGRLCKPERSDGKHNKAGSKHISARGPQQENQDR
jgi:hypothetical protein